MSTSPAERTKSPLGMMTRPSCSTAQMRRLEAYLSRSLTSLSPAQRGLGREGELHHFCPALGEGLDLGCGGEAEYAGDLRGCGLFRVQARGRGRGLVLEKDHLAEVFHRAHPRDGVADAQLLAREAAEHVYGVVARDGDEQVGVGDAGLGEDVVVRAVAVEHHGVHAGGDLLETLGVVVHDGDVVALVREAAGDLLPHASASDQNDLHCPLRSCCLDTFARRRRPRLRGWALFAA